MKILLTGCEGQVGSSVMKQIPEVIACNKTMLNIAELSSVKENIEKYGPEVVINCAAYTAVDKAESDEKTAFAVNAKGPENLAKICGDKNIVLLHLSTDYVFDGQKKTPYLETDMPNPTSVYGHSKWEGEKAIREFCARYIILRVSWRARK
jgi:dTDP-4-dehydrorhamnose reductase